MLTSISCFLDLLGFVSPEDVETRGIDVHTKYVSYNIEYERLNLCSVGFVELG